MYISLVMGTQRAGQSALPCAEGRSQDTAVSAGVLKFLSSFEQLLCKFVADRSQFIPAKMECLGEAE